MQELTIQILKTIIWLAFPICGLIGWIYYNRARHEERRLWIEQGQNPDNYVDKKNPASQIWLKLGMVVLFLGLGLLIIAILVHFSIMGNSPAIYPAILAICGGAGLILSHYLGKSKASK